MSAAQGMFAFATINAADVSGLSTAVVAQLIVFASYIDARLNDISQTVSGLSNEITTSIELTLTIAFEDINNRITRAEMRNEEIAQTGNRVVTEMAKWTTHITKMMQHFRLELDDVIRQAKDKFIDVETSQQQLRSQDTESLQADFRTFASQSDHRFQTLETRLDDLAMPAVSAEREDPWWNRNDPWWHPQATWSGGTGAPAQEKRVTFAMNADDDVTSGQSREEVAQSGYPGATPPGFSEPSTASTPAWQPSYTKGSSWQGWQPQGHVSEFKVDTRNWKGAYLDLDAKPEGFQAWRDRARVHLSGSRLDVRRLLQ